MRRLWLRFNTQNLAVILPNLAPISKGGVALQPQHVKIWLKLYLLHVDVRCAKFHQEDRAM